MAQAFDITQHLDKQVSKEAFLDIFFSPEFKAELEKRGAIDSDLEAVYREGRGGTIILAGNVDDLLVESFGKDGAITVGSIADKLTKTGKIDMAGLSAMVAAEPMFAEKLGLTAEVTKAKETAARAVAEDGLLDMAEIEEPVDVTVAPKPKQTAVAADGLTGLAEVEEPVAVASAGKPTQHAWKTTPRPDDGSADPIEDKSQAASASIEELKGKHLFNSPQDAGLGLAYIIAQTVEHELGIESTQELIDKFPAIAEELDITPEMGMREVSVTLGRAAAHVFKDLHSRYGAGAPVQTINALEDEISIYYQQIANDYKTSGIAKKLKNGEELTKLEEALYKDATAVALLQEAFTKMKESGAEQTIYAGVTAIMNPEGLPIATLEQRKVRQNYMDYRDQLAEPMGGDMNKIWGMIQMAAQLFGIDLNMLQGVAQMVGIELPGMGGQPEATPEQKLKELKDQAFNMAKDGLTPDERAKLQELAKSEEAAAAINQGIKTGLQLASSRPSGPVPDETGKGPSGPVVQ